MSYYDDEDAAWRGEGRRSWARGNKRNWQRQAPGGRFGSCYDDEDAAWREEELRRQQELEETIRDIHRQTDRFMAELNGSSSREEEEESWLGNTLKSVGRSLLNTAKRKAEEERNRRNARYHAIDRDMAAWEREDARFQRDMKRLEDDFNDSW